MNLRQLSADKPLVKKIQECLTLAGYLDPEFLVNKDLTVGYKPADGVLGPNTEAALHSYFQIIHDKALEFVDNKDVYDTLLRHNPILYLNTVGTAAEKILVAMLERGYYISRNPGTYNIVYLEGVTRLEDGTFQLNDNAVDGWNDLRMLINIDHDGCPQISGCWQATTGPGKPYIDNPMNPDGAARIKFGQYKAWIYGKHKGTQTALQQNGPIVVCRDLNKDGQREGDREFLSMVTINQHTTSYHFNGEKVGPHSAGCLVGRFYHEHHNFMTDIREDSRYQRNNAYQFITTVMDGKWIF